MGERGRGGCTCGEMRGRHGLHVHVCVNNEGPGRRVNMRVIEGGRIYIYVYE